MKTRGINCLRFLYEQQILPDSTKDSRLSVEETNKGAELYNSNREHIL